MRLVRVILQKPLPQPSHRIQTRRLHLAKLAQSRGEQVRKRLSAYGRTGDEGLDEGTLGDYFLVFDGGDGGGDEGSVCVEIGVRI